MSVRVMSLVWQHFPKGGADMLAMLALADWGADDGSNIYPSVAAVAQKIRVSEKQARRILHRIAAENYISVVGNVAGGAPGTTRHYRINIERLTAPTDGRGTAPTDGRGTAPTQGIPSGGTAPTQGIPSRGETAPTHGSLSIIKPLRKTLDTSGEPQNDSPPAITLPLVDKTEFPISSNQVQEFQSLYPAVDVMQELREMRGWCISNPTKRKTRKGVMAFVNGWLSREQDKGPRPVTQARASPRRSFDDIRRDSDERLRKIQEREVVGERVD